MNYYAIADMCHAKFVWVEREEEDQQPPPSLMQLYVEYNQDQWQLYNELFVEVYGGNYGAYYHILLEELELGPYWSDIKAQLGQVQEEYDPEASVSGSREHSPPLTPTRKTTSTSKKAA